jgi:nucleoside-diphosphate-sugar epimerase
VTFSADPDKVIPHVVAATEAILEAASNVPSVERVILTSSSAAAATPQPGEGSLALNQGQPPIPSALCASVSEIALYGG